MQICVNGELQNFRVNFFSPSAHHKSAEQHGHVICPYHLGGASVSFPSTWGQPGVWCEHECEASPADSLALQAGGVGTARCCSPPLGAPRCPIAFHAGAPDDEKYPGDDRFRGEALFTQVMLKSE